LYDAATKSLFGLSWGMDNSTGFDKCNEAGCIVQTDPATGKSTVAYNQDPSLCSNVVSLTLNGADFVFTCYSTAAKKFLVISVSRASKTATPLAAFNSSSFVAADGATGVIYVSTFDDGSLHKILPGAAPVMLVQSLTKSATWLHLDSTGRYLFAQADKTTIVRVDLPDNSISTKDIGGYVGQAYDGAVVPTSFGSTVYLYTGEYLASGAASFACISFASWR
jgi:hypothetical protein